MKIIKKIIFVNRFKDENYKKNIFCKSFFHDVKKKCCIFFSSSLTTAVAARHRQDIPNDTSVVHKNCIHRLKKS